MKLVALASLLALGCGTSVPGEDGEDFETIYGEGMGTPENPAPQQAKTGPYKMTTTVDFTIEAIAAAGQSPARVEGAAVQFGDLAKSRA